MLEAVGFDRATHDVYRAMLLHPSWTFEDITRHTSLTSDQVRAALDRLTELSLLHEATDHRFVPVSPEVGLSPRLQRLEAELDEQRARLSRDRAALAALTSEYAARAALIGDGGVERLTGDEAVRARVTELVNNARTEVCALAPAAAAASDEWLDERQSVALSLLRRGVRTRTVHLDSVRNNATAVDRAAWLASLGGEARTMPTLPMHLTLCDRSAAVMPVDPDDQAHGVLLIRHPSLVRALEELFLMVWERASPLGGASVTVTPPDGLPAERDLTLLRLLEAGLTDEGISRKMGVSLRTVRRNMSDLFKRLGAQSRFQAGAEAVRRGWL
ncbi:helix-turn-helix domain-containing protein [Streptomyces coacervatus]|uniref:Helix-turn-helix domain-containing protein n=1 Tax=Streptomyces coacervatus TaxID=647381 RepID=A0ABP7IKJ2_9ACTN|nr:helix-turn-helix domain-containing protein [Streptomyces coacervatus]MDF2273039.1 helix-turn-helix domain-containing protein [Streptomyces coacervatus]